MSAGAGVPGSLGGVIGARLDCLCSREHLLSAQALSGDRVDGPQGSWVVEIGLLIVQKRLVFIAGALGVVEDVLGGGTSCLGESGLGLSAILIGLLGPVGCADVDVVVELGLLLVQALLLTISDRLLTVSESLLEAGNPLISVKALLGAILGHGHSLGFGGW